MTFNTNSRCIKSLYYRIPSFDYAALKAKTCNLKHQINYFLPWMYYGAWHGSKAGSLAYDAA